MKARSKPTSSGDEDADDWDYTSEDPRFKAAGAKDRQNRRGMMAQAPRNTGRSRPTNNQLLYKAYFRWNHYGFKLRTGAAHLPTETDACPSVTAAFLQVLHTLSLAEQDRVGEKRNILHILSNNTRRTKVVELSTGTHRVPDELRKHYLSDGESGQYSTNLDRNRYGNDDQYLFTVIRYDLEYLGLCPCMVDVEIIDAKNDHQSIFVSAGPEACMCYKEAPFMARQDYVPRATPRDVAPPAPAGRESPRRSGSGVSQLFDALLMAATGGTEGAAAAVAGGEPPVDSRGAGQAAPAAQPGPSNGATAAVGTGARQHPAVGRQRSRLWSALSYGDVDSLQNALDAFRAEDEIASVPGLSDVVGANGAALPGDSFRKRQRKPVRGPSSSMLAALDSSLFGSLLKGSGLSGLKEKSGDNAGADVISSGHAPPRPGGSGGATGSREDDSEQAEGGVGAQDEAEGGTTPAGEEGMAADGEGGGEGGMGGMDGMDGAHPPRRVRHVPRQSSAANLSVRPGLGEAKRLAEELEALQVENRRLMARLADRAYNEQRVAQLEEECHLLRQQVLEQGKSRRTAEETVVKLSTELANTRATANQVLQRVLQLSNGHGGLSLAAQLGFAAGQGGLMPPVAPEGPPMGLHPFLPMASGLHVMQAGQGPVNGAASMAAAAASLLGNAAGLQPQLPLPLPADQQRQDQQQQQPSLGLLGMGSGLGGSSGVGAKRSLDQLLKDEGGLEEGPLGAAAPGDHLDSSGSSGAKRQALEAAAAAAAAVMVGGVEDGGMAGPTSLGLLQGELGPGPELQPLPPLLAPEAGTVAGA